MCSFTLERSRLCAPGVAGDSCTSIIVISTSKLCMLVIARHLKRAEQRKWRGSQSSFAQARVSILQRPFSRLLPDWCQQRAVLVIIDRPEFHTCHRCHSRKHTAVVNGTGTATKGICLHHLWPQVQPQVQSEPAQSGAHRRAQLRLRGVRTAICVATAPQEAPHEARQGVLVSTFLPALSRSASQSGHAFALLCTSLLSNCPQNVLAHRRSFFICSCPTFTIWDILINCMVCYSHQH